MMQSDNNQRVKKYYVYGHYTEDTDVLFYIGVGTILYLKSKTKTQRYSRAYHSSNKTNIWKNVKKKHGIVVKILYEYYTKQESLDKEKELIEKFGRRVMNTGYLTNICTGGKIGPTGRTYKMSPEQKKLLSDQRSMDFYIYNKEGEFLQKIRTLKNVAKFCGVVPNAISSCLKTKNYSNGFFIFREFKGELLGYSFEDLNFKPLRSKKVITRDLEGTEILHLSIRDATLYLQTDRKNLKSAISNGRICKKHYVYFERTISSQDPKD